MPSISSHIVAIASCSATFFWLAASFRCFFANASCSDFRFPFPFPFFPGVCGIVAAAAATGACAAGSGSRGGTTREFSR
jgi:hypothetical protein